MAARDLLANLWLAVIIWVRQDWAGDLAEVRDSPSKVLFSPPDLPVFRYSSRLQKGFLGNQLKT